MMTAAHRLLSLVTTLFSLALAIALGIALWTFQKSANGWLRMTEASRKRNRRKGSQPRKKAARARRQPALVAISVSRLPNRTFQESRERIASRQTQILAAERPHLRAG
jgi:hypothetical protein